MVNYYHYYEIMSITHYLPSILETSIKILVIFAHILLGHDFVGCLPLYDGVYMTTPQT